MAFVDSDDGVKGWRGILEFLSPALCGAQPPINGVSIPAKSTRRISSKYVVMQIICKKWIIFWQNRI